MAVDGGASDTTEPARGSSTGTDVSLKEYVEIMVNSLRIEVNQHFKLNDRAYNDAKETAKEAVEKALSSAKEAVDKAEVAASKRFEATNEFRGQLADQAQTFQRKDVSDNAFTNIRKDIENLREDISTIQSAMARIGGFDTGEIANRIKRGSLDTQLISIIAVLAVIIIPVVTYIINRQGL